jgi:predicted hydrocarbon binding protein
MSRTSAGPETPSINPEFPLLLLETMRDMDRPEEVLEGENLAVSLPRRLGLSDVVFLQIHRFRDETKRRRPQSPAVVEDLVRLVIRRPDAEEIFQEAGRRLARRDWSEKSASGRLWLRLLPAGVRLRRAAKAVQRLLRQVTGGAALEVRGRPLLVRIPGCLTARADPGGAACAFYTGVIAEVLTGYTGRPHAVQHPHCETRRGDACEWTVTVVG